MLEESIRKTIEHEKLFKPDDTLIIALSGGADSVALLLAIHSMGYKVSAAHCNFHLRGGESMRDEKFVRELCKSINVQLNTIDFNTREYADKNHLSIEMAARELRYDYFEKLRLKIKAKAILVAHHRDDSVETMLLNLIRGTGLTGMQGIKYVHGNIIRPMLDISRNDIIEYLKTKQQDYVTDSTNLIPDFTRNRIRLQLLPLMRGINPSVDNTLQQTIERLREVGTIYEDAINSARQLVTSDDGKRIDISLLLKSKAPKSILFELLYPYGFMPNQIAQVFEGLNGESGAIYESKTWQLLRDRKHLILRKKEKVEQKPIEALMVSKDGTFEIDGDKSITISFSSREELTEISKTKDKVCLDADKVGKNMIIRRAERADRFVPFGMKGSKLLSDYMTDIKMNIYEKEKQLVVCNSKGIVWLVGERPDNNYRIDKDTKNIVCISITKNKKKETE